MIELEEAMDQILSHMECKREFISIPLSKAYGYIICNDIYAPIDVPPYKKSAMDGYAVRSIDCAGASKDMPVRLDVLGVVYAGDAHGLALHSNQAVRIMTGGMMPIGSDSVVMQENTDYGNSQVEIYRGTMPYENCCMTGEDIEKGMLAIRKYTMLNSVHIGILAGLGIHEVEVIRPLRASIIATGNELNPLELPLAPGKIYNSCSYMIASKIEAGGLTVARMEQCGDTAEDVARCIIDAIEDSDFIITTGGVSVGEKDVVPNAVKAIGANILFHRINVKPGTPIMGSVYDSKIILSLSGNPFAALTTFELFFWQIASYYMKNQLYDKRKGCGIYRGANLKQNPLKRFVRAYVSEGVVSLPSNNHAASVISNLVECNCLLIQPEKKELQDGDAVDLIYIDY